MRQTSKSKKKSRGGLCGIIVAIAVVAIVAIIFSGHSNTSTPILTPTQNTQLTNEQEAAATLTALAQVNPQATNVYVKPAPGATYMPQPTDTPTPTPQPTHQATPRPTPRPTQPPTCQAINNNPWCDNFSPGNLIYNPPSNFCDYFNCIASFWGADDPGDGYVVECADSTFSQSGSERGACSSHGGVSRPLYFH